MSFKREGDDPDQLGVLQKRRVADLLANYIPEDEALLLRSGRYTCTVCAHRPIFDTLAVLMVHRAGRRHTSSLQHFYRRLSQQELPREQQQKEGVQGEEEAPVAPLLLRTRSVARSALLRASPYSSCCHRTGGVRSSPRSPVTRRPPRGVGPGASCPEAAGTARGAPAQSQHRGKGGGSLVTQSCPETPGPERRRALQRYLQLRSAGWIQDPSGKWVKDENVEFDSDEEEPPSPLVA